LSTDQWPWPWFETATKFPPASSSLLESSPPRRPDPNIDEERLMLVSVLVCQLLLDDPYGGDPDRSCFFVPLNMRESEAKNPLFFFLLPLDRMLERSDPGRPRSSEKVRRKGVRPVGGR